MLGTAGIAAGVVPAVMDVVNNNTAGGKSCVQNALEGLVWRYLGWNMSTMQFDIEGLKYGLAPAAIGIGGSMLASKLGVNRWLGQHGVPFLRF